MENFPCVCFFHVIKITTSISEAWTSEYQRSFYVKIVHLRQMEVYRFQSKAARRYHDLKRMNELQEQYLYLVNHKIESADEMLDRHAQIKEKIADISAEQKMIYAENRKPGRLSEDEAATIRLDNTERLEALKNRKKKLNHELKLADSIITESMEACGMHTGSAKKLSQEDMVQIYKIAKSKNCFI